MNDITVAIRKCGGTWACCDGDCKNCSATTSTYTNNTIDERKK